MSEQHQSNAQDINDKDLQEIQHNTNWSLILVAIFIAIVFGSYFWNFHGGELSKDGGTWGAFGDFIGGILNPTIAALALYWLVSSIKLQVTELQATNKALNETVKTAKIQQDQVSLQNFENLFFQLLKAKTDVTNDIIFSIEKFDHQGEEITYLIFNGKDAIKKGVILFKSSLLDKKWQYYYIENMLDYIGSYFRVCYQLVKIIDSNEVIKGKDSCDYTVKQKEYFDIFRSTLTQYELELIFFNCLSIYGRDKFKKIITKYGMFEPLPIDFNRKEGRIHRLTRDAYQYDPKIFEKNESWRLYFEEINSIKLNIRIDDLIDCFTNIKNTKIISYENIYSEIIENKENFVSGYKYNINNILAFNHLKEVFYSDEINIVKNLINDDYLYNLNQIKDFEDVIDVIENLIIKCKNWFIENKKRIDYNELVFLGDINEKNQTIKQLLVLKKENKHKIQKIISENKEFDENIERIKKSEYTSTVLILIKYGISYVEYSDYLNKNITG